MISSLIHGRFIKHTTGIAFFSMIFSRMNNLKILIILKSNELIRNLNKKVIGVPFIIKNWPFAAILLFDFDIIMLLEMHYEALPQSVLNKRNQF